MADFYTQLYLQPYENQTEGEGIYVFYRRPFLYSQFSTTT